MTCEALPAEIDLSDLASEALAKTKIVPKADYERLKSGAEKWLKDLPGLVARQKELEKVIASALR